MMDIAHGTGVAKGRNVPSTLPLGTDTYAGIKNVCEGTLMKLEEWKDVICSTDFSEEQLCTTAY
jgi:hypothetical protein